MDTGSSAAAVGAPPRRTIALIAHDNKKLDLVAWAKSNYALLQGFDVVATGTTGQRVHEATGLPVTRFLSGPLGGDAQIAALVCTGQCAGVFFIVDPLSAHPHDPDIQGLLRICNVHNIPVATNLATAQAVLAALAR